MKLNNKEENEEREKKSNTNISTLGAALNRLGINYREFPHRSGEFYFCTIPENELSFDIQYEEDGMVRLWRFVGTAPLSKAGRRYEYRSPKFPHAAVGVEVTDEGDISYYAERKIDIADSRSATLIDRLIRGYIKLLAEFPRMLTIIN